MSGPQDALNEQDPDYVSNVPNNEVQQKAFEQNARTNTARKLRDIFDREFSKEIDSKEKEVLEIQERLQKSLKTLHLLRYVIVTDYYTRKQCQLPEVQTESKQTRIHPAIKQLIGKRPQGIKSSFIDAPSSTLISTNDNESSMTVKPSSSKSQCFENIENCSTKTASKRIHEEESESTIEPPKKIPRYIPPKSSSPEPTIPSRGVHNKVRRKVIIGNISKWIPPDWRDDEASHKWTVYVRKCKDDEDVSEIVSKVRFFLHPTYKPHDVVEISSSPFHLTRRGWGEFPIRVQLHFKNPLDKPKDVIHYLKLDQTYTGLQTLGSEAVYGFWLHSTNPMPSHLSDTKDLTKEIEENSSVKSEKLASKKSTQSCETHLVNDNNLQKKNDCENINKLKLCIRNEHDYAAMDYVVQNNRTIVHVSNGHSKSNSATLSSPILTINSDTTNDIAQINGGEQMTEEELATVVSHANKPHCKANSMTSVAMNCQSCPAKMQPLNITIPSQFETKKKQFLILKNNKLIPTNSANVCNNKVADNNGIENAASNKTKAIKATNISKTITLSSNSFTFNSNSIIPALQIVERSNDFVQKNGHYIEQNDGLKDKERKFKVNGKEKQKLTKKDVWDDMTRSIVNYKFTDTASLVKFIIKRVPLITPEAYDPEYKRLHPYSCASFDEFMACNIGKQKYLEWYRAKVVRSFMKKCITSSEDLWTMKEIMIWARQYGYTPITSTMSNRNSQSVKSAVKEPNSSANTISCTRTEMTELEDWFLKCQAENDSQSDTEIDIENIIEKSHILKKSSRVENISKSNTENDNSEFLELPDELQPLYSFVSETTREYGGVKLNNETIYPGIKHCAAARVMMQALQCLVSDIARFSNAQALDRIRNSGSHSQSPLMIVESDVKGALTMREEFDIFTNVGLGTKQKIVEWNSD